MCYYDNNNKYVGAANECLRDYAGEMTQDKPKAIYTHAEYVSIHEWMRKYNIGTAATDSTSNIGADDLLGKGGGVVKTCPICRITTQCY